MRGIFDEKVGFDVVTALKVCSFMLNKARRETKSSIHLSVVLLEGLVLLQKLLLALLAGELEHGDSVDAVCHCDGC